MIRILYVIENSFYGGGERNFAQLINGLDKSKYEIFVATIPEGRFFEDIKNFAQIIPFDLKQQLQLSNIKKLANIINNGFVVIQTQDIRIDGYIEPLAQKIVDKLKHDNLWLKEIVVVTQEDNISNSINSIEYLKIVHQYLLIYDVRK